MNIEILKLLKKNGYLVQQSKNQLLIRKKVMTDWKLFVSLFVPGFIIFIFIVWLKSETNPGLIVFLLVSSIVLMVVPFFQYFTSSYRSLLIDFNNQSLLFRSSISRAYRFFEIAELSLEIVKRESGRWGNGDHLQLYLVAIQFVNGAKEELLSITFGQEDNEQQIFKLKDYFQVLLSQRSRS